MRIVEREIVGAFIFSADNYLLLGKSRQGGVYQNTWIVPGGGIEPSETLHEAIIRETKEETGVDIAPYMLEQLAHVTNGESVKTLRPSGEVVKVKMRFHDFVVRIPEEAKDIVCRPGDDMEEVGWFSNTQTAKLSITEPMKRVLEKLRYL